METVGHRSLSEFSCKQGTSRVMGKSNTGGEKCQDGCIINKEGCR